MKTTAPNQRSRTYKRRRSPTLQKLLSESHESTSAEPERFEWTTQSAFALAVQRGERALAVMVSVRNGFEWHVVAIETSSGIRSMGDLFSEHAHKVVGTYDEVSRAMQAAESFARSWLKGTKSTRHEQCECGEIGGMDHSSGQSREPVP